MVCVHYLFVLCIRRVALRAMQGAGQSLELSCHGLDLALQHLVLVFGCCVSCDIYLCARVRVHTRCLCVMYWCVLRAWMHKSVQPCVCVCKSKTYAHMQL